MNTSSCISVALETLLLLAFSSILRHAAVVSYLWRLATVCDISNPRLSNGQTVTSVLFVPHRSLDSEIVASMAELQQEIRAFLESLSAIIGGVAALLNLPFNLSVRFVWALSSWLSWPTLWPTLSQEGSNGASVELCDSNSANSRVEEIQISSSDSGVTSTSHECVSPVQAKVRMFEKQIQRENDARYLRVLASFTRTAPGFPECATSDALSIFHVMPHAGSRSQTGIHPATLKVNSQEQETHINGGTTRRESEYSASGLLRSMSSIDSLNFDGNDVNNARSVDTTEQEMECKMTINNTMRRSVFGGSRSSFHSEVTEYDEGAGDVVVGATKVRNIATATVVRSLVPDVIVHDEDEEDYFALAAVSYITSDEQRALKFAEERRLQLLENEKAMFEWKIPAVKSNSSRSGRVTFHGDVSCHLQEAQMRAARHCMTTSGELGF